MEQGTIVTWKKNEGDPIAVGEELYEVETEKTIVTIEATRPGRLVKILVPPGEPILVGSVLAIAADPNEQVSAAQLEAATSDTVGVDAAPITAPPIERQVGKRGKRAAVPKARLLASELGVDLASVHGTGDGGMILPEDVRRTANGSVPGKKRSAIQVPAGATSPSRKPLSQFARATVAALESASGIPTFTQGVLIDATALQRAKDASRTLSYMDFFLDAIVRAARAVPNVLARVADGEIEHFTSIDISIATATDVGLMIPVLRDAGARTIEQRAAAWREVVAGARAGTLGAQGLSGGLIALSNLGASGVDYGTALLPSGHSTIVFVGSLAPRALVVDDALEIRPSVHLGITYDHRVVDGIVAAQFTRAIHEALVNTAL
jgi:pyruvate dehydrogenase E2 component (dihydrolipoamide acetyltransferase)